MPEQFSREVLKAWLLQPGLCVLALVFLAAPLQAQDKAAVLEIIPCEEFLDQEIDDLQRQADTAKGSERISQKQFIRVLSGLCMVQMRNSFPAAWEKLKALDPRVELDPDANNYVPSVATIHQALNVVIEGSCDNFFDLATAKNASHKQRQTCLAEIRRTYQIASRILPLSQPEGRGSMSIGSGNVSATGEEIYQALNKMKTASCDKFFDLTSAKAATPDEAELCVYVMEIKYPAAWEKLKTGPAGEGFLVSGISPPGERIYEALADAKSARERSPTGSATALPSPLGERVSPPSEDSILSRAGLWLIAPGAYVLSWLWITPQSWFGLIAATLLSWWLYVTLARLAWVIPGRIFGLYNPAHFRFFTWLPWRPLYRRLWLPVSWWKEEMFSTGKVSMARPAGLLETMAHVYKPGSIYLGRFRPFALPAFQPVGIDGSGGRHLCMIAGTGGGKTAHLITMLGLHEGTAFIIDPKGQIARVMARRMGEGGNGVIGKGKKVCILDPSGTGKEHASLLAKWNPFVELRRAGERAAKRGLDPAHATVEFAQKMVNGLVIQHPKQDPFWPGAARDFLHGLILHVYTTEPPERQTLGRLYELLTVGLPEKVTDPSKYTGFDVLLSYMAQNRAFGGVIAQSISGIQDASSNTAGSVLFTMREQLQWLKLPGLREVSESSSFTLDELHSGNLVLFVCAKLNDIKETFPGWFRLLSVLALAVFEDINQPLKHPCLFALDEFPSLGKITAVETAAPYMRSYGVRLLIVAQNIGQLKGIYENWETFTGNSECTWWMATQHDDNLTHLERTLGKATVKEKLDGPPWWWPFSKRAGRHGLKEREVMTAEEIRRFLARGNVIVTRGQRAFLLKPELYFKALPVCFYENDTNYRETLPRSLMREIFARLIAPRIAGPVGLPEKDVEPVLGPLPAPVSESVESSTPIAAAPPPVLPSIASDEVFTDAFDADDESAITKQEPVEAPSPVSVSSPQRPLPSVDFLRLFEECFDGTDGAYPHPELRRKILNFSDRLTQGGDFQTLHIGFEDWLCSPESGLKKHQAERVVVYFDNAVERWRQKRKKVSGT